MHVDVATGDFHGRFRQPLPFAVERVEWHAGTSAAQASYA